MNSSLDCLLSRYAPAVPGAKTEFCVFRKAVVLTAEGHQAAAVFLRCIAGMHETSRAELLIGLANYHLQQAAEKS